jgi:hypothetical protein
MVDTGDVAQLGSPAREDPPGARRRGTFLPELALLVLGAEVCRHLAWPVRSAGLAFAVAAVVVGATAYGRVRYAGGRWQLFAVTAGLVAAGLLVSAHLVLLLSGLFLPDYEECVRRALTRGAEQACQQQLDLRIAEIVGRP